MRDIFHEQNRINRGFMAFGSNNHPTLKTGFPIVVFFLIFGMSGPVSAGTGAVLPDYENEARIVFHGMCDDGKVSYRTYYKQGGYVLEVARILPEEFFYFIKRYRGKEEGWEERYFRQVNISSNLRELAHEEWDENVKQLSVNYFNKLHDLHTTCTKMLVS